MGQAEPQVMELEPITAEVESSVTLDRLSRPLLRFSTAGSVDDGKSTLIGRLLHDTKSLYDDHLESIKKASAKEGRKASLSFALLTDGLRAEREQGITIDVAYRYFSTPKRNFIMADTPGHEQYTRNMATGASTAQVTVILVDARKGILTQTRRHAFVASLLGVSTFVLAVNKMDLIGYSEKTFRAITDDFREFAARLGVTSLYSIPVSALHGENIVERSAHMPWYTGDTLLATLESIDVERKEADVDFRFPVQLVFKGKSGGRVYAGKVASGVIRVGDEVTVLPSLRKSVVTSIESYSSDLKQKKRDYALAPQSVTIGLQDEVDIGRGSMLVRGRVLPQVRNSFEAMMVWMSAEPLDLRRPYLLMHGTQEARVYFDTLSYKVDMDSLKRTETHELGLNDIGRVKFSSPSQLYFDTYRHNRATGNFIVIDPETFATVGAGMVVARTDHILIDEAPEISAAPVSTNIHREVGTISRTLREAHFGFPAVTLWFTGLSGAGKSALAKYLERLFLQEGRVCYRLDGDNLRFGLNRDLGFSEEDRAENIRRAAEVAQLFNDAGITTLCSFISPYQQDRDNARKVIGAERFIEVYVAAPIGVCESRDPHGLYQKARSGLIKEFTGISSPYEEPRSPELTIDTSDRTLDECAQQIHAFIRGKYPRIPSV